MNQIIEFMSELSQIVFLGTATAVVIALGTLIISLVAFLVKGLIRNIMEKDEGYK